jgi:hypothetical protein
MKLQNVSFDGVDTRDYPDFCDAFIDYAEYEDGTPLTEDELDAIPSDVFYEKLMEFIF